MQITQQIGEIDVISVIINLVAANGIEEVTEVSSLAVALCLLHDYFVNQACVVHKQGMTATVCIGRPSWTCLYACPARMALQERPFSRLSLGQV